MSLQTTPTHVVPEFTLGWRLRLSLEANDITVAEMAEQLGYSRSQLSRWMHDGGNLPRRSALAQWALATGVPLEWLLTGQEPEDGPNGPGGQYLKWLTGPDLHVVLSSAA